MNPNDEFTIQRLVDNELSDDERAELMRRAEEHPRLWKSIALALIEDRVWSSVVRAGQPENTAAPARQPVPMASRRPSLWETRAPRILLTAAAVLLVLTVAVRFYPASDGRPFPSPDGRGQTTNQESSEPTESAPDNLPPRRLASHHGPWRLQMDENLNVPLFEDVGQMEEELARLDLDFDRKVTQQLLQAGYRVEPRIDYITGSAPDGRSFIVPVHRYHVRRFGQ